jgi:hypothetical protein
VSGKHVAHATRVHLAQSRASRLPLTGSRRRLSKVRSRGEVRVSAGIVPAGPMTPSLTHPHVSPPSCWAKVADCGCAVAGSSSTRMGRLDAENQPACGHLFGRCRTESLQPIERAIATGNSQMIEATAASCQRSASAMRSRSSCWSSRPPMRSGLLCQRVSHAKPHRVGRTVAEPVRGILQRSCACRPAQPEIVACLPRARSCWGWRIDDNRQHPHSARGYRSPTRVSTSGGPAQSAMHRLSSVDQPPESVRVRTPALRPRHRQAQARCLPQDAGVPERVAPRLRPHAHPMRPAADRDAVQQAPRAGADGVDLGVVAA